MVITSALVEGFSVSRMWDLKKILALSFPPIRHCVPKFPKEHLDTSPSYTLVLYELLFLLESESAP